MILLLASSENLRAHTLSLGTINILSSSRTFPAKTKVFYLFSSVSAILTNLEIDIGYLVVLE
jgi:hypothetical protein